MRIAKILALFFLFNSPLAAEQTKTVFNPFTGKIDYITRVDSTTLPSGSTQYVQIAPAATQSGGFDVATGSVSTSIVTPIVLSNGSSLMFKMSGTEIMRMTSTGLGIGSTNPAQPFVVGGTQSGNAGMEIFATSGVGISAYNRTTALYTSMAFDTAVTSFRHKAVGGNAITFKYVNATSLTSAVTGVHIDMSTSLTSTNLGVSGASITLPAAANGDASTRQYTGLDISQYSITQTTSSGVNNWNGIKIVMPAVIQTSGTITPTGINIFGGTLTNGATNFAITTDAAAGQVSFGGNVGIKTAVPQATLDLQGSLRGITTATSTNYQTTIADSTVYATTGVGGITVTLPAASANTIGLFFFVYKVDAGVGALTVAGAGSDTINGLASKTIANQWNGALLRGYTATSWICTSFTGL